MTASTSPGQQPSPAAHLANFSRIDIALDTYPYNGTTMTAEALWMGVPVVTLAGPTRRSRVGLSLLSAAGLPHLAAHSPTQYTQVATHLASDLQNLSNLRAALRPRLAASPLTDAPAFTRSLEKALSNLCKSHSQFHPLEPRCAFVAP